MLSLPLGDIFNLIQGERVFEAVHVHLTIVVLEVSVQEWDEILLLTLFIDLDVAAPVKDVPLDLPGLLHRFKADSVALVEVCIFVTYDVAIQIMLLEERGLSRVQSLIFAKHNEHYFVHRGEPLFVLVHQRMGFLIV